MHTLHFMYSTHFLVSDRRKNWEMILMCFVTMTVWNCIIDSGTQSGLETNYHHQTTSGYLLEMMIAQSREEVLPQLILNKDCKTLEASLIKLELITLIRSDILALKTLQPAILECERWDLKWAANIQFRCWGWQINKTVCSHDNTQLSTLHQHLLSAQK